jgi:hypothetical protein
LNPRGVREPRRRAKSIVRSVLGSIRAPWPGAELFAPKKRTPRPGLAQATDGRMADVVAAGDVGRRLVGGNGTMKSVTFGRDADQLVGLIDNRQGGFSV